MVDHDQERSARRGSAPPPPAGYVGAGVFIALGAYLLLDRDTSETDRVRKRISEDVFGLCECFGASIPDRQLLLAVK